MKKLLISQPWPTWMVTEYDYYCKMLEARGFTIVLHPKLTSLTEDELIDALKDTVVHLCGNEPYNERVFNHPNAKDLRMITKLGVGIETIDIPEATKHGVFVANTPGAGAESVAEFALTLMLAMARHLPQNENIYRRIRDMREDADLLQKDVASYLKCTQVSYSYYELGKRNLPTDVLIKLALFYHTSTDYLLGLTDVKTPYPPSKG